MKMTVEGLKERINSICTHVSFEYNGKACGIDPFSKSEFDMWCGHNTMSVRSVEEVMSVPFFDGKALKDIVDKIENIEY